MKFQNYLKQLKEKPVPWAKRKGLSSATIWRVFRGKVFPSKDTIMAIEKATDGMVKPDDWYNE